MKKMIYLLAVAFVLGSLSFKPAGENLEITKHHVALKKQSVKKKTFSNIAVNFYNPVEAGGYHLKLTSDATSTVYEFDIPQYGITGYLGTIPQGSYTVDVYNNYDTFHNYWLQIGSDGDGYLAGTGPVWHDIMVLMNYDQTVSITNP
jgi:hypothetical protein